MSLDGHGESDRSKRIVKNTIFLYARMLFTMGVTLYTSRVVLDVLGEEDFGIFIVVGGVVALFSFLNAAMSSGTQRFLSFELGRQDLYKTRQVFCSSVNIHVLIGLIVFVLTETIGLWFLNEKLNIPDDRRDVVNWIYQCSVLSLIITIIQVPYTACLISREKMGTYAYISILDVFLKLVIVLLLPVIPMDKLKVYGSLLFSVTSITALIYVCYCSMKFEECRYLFVWNKALYKKLISFAGWNMFGAVASVSTLQGTNILLNIFFGSVINAARGIAFQAQASVNSFVSNFQVAVNPQIVKSYAQKDFPYLNKLIFQSSKYSFYLLLLLCIPFLFESGFILNIWLHKVPEMAPLFCVLVLINALIDSFSGALMTACRATGKIKTYQIVVGILLFLNLPVSYMFLRLGAPSESVFYISIFVSVLILFARAYMLSLVMNFEWAVFLKNIVLKSLSIAALILLFPLCIIYIMPESLLRFLIILTYSFTINPTIIFFLGLNKDEKKYIWDKCKQIKLKFLK